MVNNQTDHIVVYSRFGSILETGMLILCISYVLSGILGLSLAATFTCLATKVQCGTL